MLCSYLEYERFVPKTGRQQGPLIVLDNKGTLFSFSFSAVTTAQRLAVELDRFSGSGHTRK